MKTLKLIALSLAIAFGSTAIAKNQSAKSIYESGWEKLGIKSVDFKKDHDVITVSLTEGVFTKVKFVIRKAPIYLKNITIIFGNGSNKNVTLEKHLKAGASSRVIDLPGNKRIIKKIKLNYKSVKTGNGKAVIVAWGKH